MKDILQAIIDGKPLEAAGGLPISHKTALEYLSRGLTVKVRPDTIKRYIPVMRMPAGSVILTGAVVDRVSAMDSSYNGQREGDKLAGILHVEIEPVSLKLVHAELEEL